MICIIAYTTIIIASLSFFGLANERRVPKDCEMENRQDQIQSGNQKEDQDARTISSPLWCSTSFSDREEN